MAKVTLPFLHQHEFRAATAHIDNDRIAIFQITVLLQDILHGDVRQAVLFRALDNFHVDLGGHVEAIHKSVTVLGLAHRAGGNRANLVIARDTVLGHHFAKTQQHLDAILDGRSLDATGAERVLAEP